IPSVGFEQDDARQLDLPAERIRPPCGQTARRDRKLGDRQRRYLLDQPLLARRLAARSEVEPLLETVQAGYVTPPRRPENVRLQSLRELSRSQRGLEDGPPAASGDRQPKPQRIGEAEDGVANGLGFYPK